MSRNFQIQELLRNKNLRVTRARVAVLEMLSQRKKPIDVIEIENYLDQKKIQVDQVTIYRMLDAFLEKKLITRLDFQEGKFRYEFFSSDHHHLICEDCGQIQDIDMCPVEEIENQIARTQNFAITRHALEFFGFCGACR